MYVDAWRSGVLRWVLAALVAVAAPAHADEETGRVLHVGPDQDLRLPSSAARLARDGDTVEIAAGEYSGDVAVWRQNRLTLRGVSGRAHLRAAGRAAEGKAIWVIKGDDVLVENIEMSGTRVPGFAGAGIRAEGGKLTLRNVHFHHNQMGILTNNNGRGELTIIDSELNHNIVDHARHGRLGHNIYVGRIASFELRGSHVHGAVTGHQVKSRARINLIRGNRIVDGDGGSSYLIDISEGGAAQVLDNELQQSERAPNRVAIAFAPEARDKSAAGMLYVSGNRFTSEGSRATFVRNFSRTVEAVLSHNELHGDVTALAGPGEVR